MTSNDKAWQKLFDKYNILKNIETTNIFKISASQIREFREPRLMAKFDHAKNLPKIFVDNDLSILPVTRSDYVISHFDVYHNFEDSALSVENFSLPSHIQTLSYDNITNEAMAINCAVASGIIADFISDEDLYATVSGRMSSGCFSFNINNKKSSSSDEIIVDGSQIEIDGAYEGISNFTLIEAKNHISDDFLLRQLYYPFRAWKSRITKQIRSIFLIYSNGIFKLYEYRFENFNDYNSLKLINQKNYSIEDTSISVSDIELVLCTTPIISEPSNIPFPQSDKFERIINLCELVNKQELTKEGIAELYDFDIRQANYYASVACYLGLLDKKTYKTTEKCKAILKLGYKQRQLMYCKCILEHSVFNKVLKLYFKAGNMPSGSDIMEIMQLAKLNGMESEVTLFRRSSTIKGWINWIVSLLD